MGWDKSIEIITSHKEPSIMIQREKDCVNQCELSQSSAESWAIMGDLNNGNNIFDGLQRLSCESQNKALVSLAEVSGIFYFRADEMSLRRDGEDKNCWTDATNARQRFRYVSLWQKQTSSSDLLAGSLWPVLLKRLLSLTPSDAEPWGHFCFYLSRNWKTAFERIQRQNVFTEARHDPPASSSTQAFRGDAQELLAQKSVDYLHSWGQMLRRAKFHSLALNWRGGRDLRQISENLAKKEQNHLHGNTPWGPCCL